MDYWAVGLAGVVLIACVVALQYWANDGDGGDED